MSGSSSMPSFPAKHPHAVLDYSFDLTTYLQGPTGYPYPYPDTIVSSIWTVTPAPVLQFDGTITTPAPDSNDCTIQPITQLFVSPVESALISKGVPGQSYLVTFRPVFASGTTDDFVALLSILDV